MIECGLHRAEAGEGGDGGSGAPDQRAARLAGCCRARRARRTHSWRRASCSSRSIDSIPCWRACVSPSPMPASAARPEQWVGLGNYDAAPRGHALSRESLEHRVLHGGQHAADPRGAARAGPRAQSWPAPEPPARRLLLPVHALGGHRRSRLALAARSGGRPLQLLPARARRARALLARRSPHRDVDDHRHHRVVGDRLLPRHLPGRAAGHPARSLRGGGARRRLRRAEPSGRSPCPCSGRCCSSSWSPT